VLQKCAELFPDGKMSMWDPFIERVAGGDDAAEEILHNAEGAGEMSLATTKVHTLMALVRTVLLRRADLSPQILKFARSVRVLLHVGCTSLDISVPGGDSVCRHPRRCAQCNARAACVPAGGLQ
jgi:hypothetical protein